MITGALGFIGTNLVETFIESNPEYELSLVDNKSNAVRDSFGSSNARLHILDNCNFEGVVGDVMAPCQKRN